MKLIVMIDNEGGVSFNDRRQSRDRYLNEYIVERIGNAKLWMNSYTYTLFDDLNCENIIVDDDFIRKMVVEDYAICEKMSLHELESKIDFLIVCNWNRDYPYDTTLDIDKKNYDVKKICDVGGKSHEKITIEEWRKRI